MSFDKFKKEYIPLVKNFDCGNVVINNFLNSENGRVKKHSLLLIVIIIAILHKKGYSSPYPIRMIL